MRNLSVLMALMTLTLSACGGGSSSDSSDPKEREVNAPKSQFQTIQNHSMFSQLVQSVTCSAGTQQASAVVFQAFVQSTFKNADGTTTVDHDRVRLLFDPAKMIFRSCADHSDNGLSALTCQSTTQYSLANDTIQIEKFGYIRLSDDKTSFIVKTLTADAENPLVKSSVAQTTQGDDLNYLGFCGP